MDKEVSRTPPLERYVSLLEIFVSCSDGLTLHELSKITGMPKASLHRLLAVMQGVGLVGIGEGSGPRYVLGQRARKLAFLAAGDEFVESVSHQQIKHLCREFDETCYIARLEGTTVRSVAMVSPDHPWRGYVLPGKRMQHHVNASAKAIFAFQPAEVLEHVLSAPRPKLTRYTKTDRSLVEAEYAEIRDRKYATCIDEVEEGLAAFAVPIDVRPHGVQFALATVGPKTKIQNMIDGGAVEEFQKAASAIASVLERH